MSRGFTLIELVLTIAVLGLIAGIGVGTYANFFRQSSLDSAANEIISTLREAQANSQASADGYAWGVHFDNLAQGTPNQFVFFRLDGANYGASSSSYKRTTVLTSSVEIPTGTSGINLNPTPGTTVDVVFDKLTGRTSNSGSVTIQLIGGSTKTINISALGKIE